MIRVRAIHVYDAFNFNGYIDMEQGRYVIPKWHAETLKGIGDYDFIVQEYGKENADYTDEDYRKIEADKERYLCTPMLDSLGTDCAVLLKMGYTWDDLFGWGVDRRQTAGAFLPGSELRRTSQPYRTSDQEWELRKHLKEIMIEVGRYDEYFKTRNQFVDNAIEAWCLENGIEMTDE